MYGLKVKQINSSNRQRRTACSGMILVFAQFSSADVGKLPLLSAEVAIVGEKAELPKKYKTPRLQVCRLAVHRPISFRFANF